MPIFVATYYDKTNKLRTIEVEQQNKEAVVEFLKRQGVAPVSVEEKKGKKGVILPGLGKISVVEKSLMARHLSTLIKIGTPVFEAVELLMDGTQNPKLKKVYQDILSALDQGRLFSTVFDKYPKDFNEIYRGIVKVGETTGTLDQAFALLADQLEKQHELQKKIKAALVYPIVLVFAIFSLILLVVLFVVPRISQVFGSVGFKLPWSTRLLIGASQFLTANPVVNTLLFILLPIAILVAVVSSRPARKIIMKVFSSTPVFKGVVLQIRLARLSRNLVTMVKSGVSLTETLEISSKAMTGTPYEKAMLNILEDVKKGITLTESMKKMPSLFPSMFIGMVRVGERTATLDQVLTHMADFYEGEADESLKNLSTFIEPALLIVIGIIVVFIALSVLVPIYSLISDLI